jgi:hypothetical protein
MFGTVRHPQIILEKKNRESLPFSRGDGFLRPIDKEAAQDFAWQKSWSVGSLFYLCSANAKMLGGIERLC